LRRNALLFIALLSICFHGGASAQTFKSPPLLPTAFDPSTVATGDFNHDGNPDLIYVDGSGQGQHTLHVLLGRGDGTFAQGQNIVLPAGICLGQCTINIADISGDGLPDLIIGGGVEINPKIAVFLGNANGSFQAAIISNLTPTPGAFSSANGLMAIADFNGDGALDLAVGVPFDGIHILLGDKSGSFTETTGLPTSTQSVDLHAVDLNHDGHLDLVALGQFASGGFSVFFGNGDGTFQFPVLHEIGAGFKGYFADFDGDGQPDVLSEFTPAFNIRQLVFIKGNPDGTFAPPVVIGQLPADFSIATVAIGDFNDDGILDLELSNHTGVGILPGQSGLTFGSMITSLSGGALFPGTLIPLVNAPVQADFNKDGHIDLAIPAAGGIELLMGNGDGSFKSDAQVYDVGTAVTTIAVADFNGDKLPDIAVATGAPIPRLLLGQTGGIFGLAPDPNTTSGSGPGSLAVGDFNGDGHADLELGPNTFNGVPTLVFGDGQGHFSAPVTVSTGSPAIADFNGDGRSDMALFNFSLGACIPGCPLTVSLGQTNNTFLTKNTILTGIQGIVTAIGDLNGDGIQDVVLNESGFLQVYLGNGDGTFTKGVTLDISSFNGGAGIDLSGAAIADIDGDGRKDLVLAPLLLLGNNFFTAPQAVMILYGQGDGTFEPPALVPVSHYYTHLKVADLNQDGRPDLVLNDDVGIAVMMNLGNRTFEDESHYVGGTAIAGLSVADVNGDGFPDLVVANPGGTTVAVLLNDPNGVPPGGVHPLMSLTVSPEPSDFNAPFTASAIVSAPSLTSAAPTGNVDFILDGTLAATVPLSAGTASFVFTGTLTPGLHQVFATYSGDTTYSTASVNQAHTVNRQIFATQTVLTATPLTLLASQTVHMEATVSAANGGNVCPPIQGNICSWGTITFLDGAKTLHSGPTDTNGRAVFDTATLGAGPHTFSAVYHGFSNAVAIFPQSTSALITVTVTSVSTATSASLSNASISAGTVVTITASVSSGSGTPFGGATFFDGTIPLGTVALHADGSATFSTASLAAGTHALSASFNANSTFAASSSAPVALVVTAPPASAIATFSALSTSLHPEKGSISFSAKVAAAHGSPQSTVVFLDKGVILGSVTTDATGSATLTIPLPASGAHSFSASFSGDSQFAPSVSPELQEFWSDSSPAFSVAVDPVIMKAVAGAASGEVSVSIAGPLQDPLQLSCSSGLPNGYSCSFSPAVLSQSGVSEVSIRRSAVSSNTAPARNKLPGSLALVAVLMGGLFSVSRRRALTAMAVLCFLGLSFLSGCGGSSREQQASQIAVVTVQATSGTGQARSVHAAQLLLMLSDR
jgi:hypothetical protein